MARRLALATLTGAAAIHAALALFELWRDHWQTPVEALVLHESALQLWTRDVVIMHHKRLRELNATLSTLARAQRRQGELRVKVAQSLDESERSAATDTAALLDALRASLPFKTLTHVPHFEQSSADASYSTDARRYGTKRNSCRNLMHGLDSVFRERPENHAALIVEDDVLLAEDALEFFDAAASVAASSDAVDVDVHRDDDEPRRVVLATGFCYPRDDHDDYPATRHLPGSLLGRRADRFRRSRLRSITFRTLAWLATREVYQAMRTDFLDGPTPMLNLGADAPLHPSLIGCAYCENLCYDHYLEWRFRHASFVCPAVPRAEADFAGGMTEHRGVLDAGGQEGYHARRRAAAGELNTQRISSADFADDTHRRAAARLVRGLALWLLPTAVLLLVFNVWRTRHACLGMRQITVDNKLREV